MGDAELRPCELQGCPRLERMTFRWRVRRAWVLPFVLVSALVTLVAAGAAAAIETDTVESPWAGIWWAISLVTTVGFVGEPPTTYAGQALSILLMVMGFLLLAMVSAALASLFVRDAEAPRDALEEQREEAMLRALSEMRRALHVSQAAGPARRTLRLGSSAPRTVRHSRRLLRAARLGGGA